MFVEGGGGACAMAQWHNGQSKPVYRLLHSPFLNYCIMCITCVYTRGVASMIVVCVSVYPRSDSTVNQTRANKLVPLVAMHLGPKDVTES